MSMSARPLASGSYSALPVLLSKYETATVRGAGAPAGVGGVAAHSVAESRRTLARAMARFCRPVAGDVNERRLSHVEMSQCGTSAGGAP